MVKYLCSSLGVGGVGGSFTGMQTWIWTHYEKQL